ncbi:zinc finger protein 501-like [Periplaneta americana]|uniref:zinc finger protein 501-like n=1 Tax=Periplaneta americana TaxID=6978 RepID=UPI0037E79B8D
MNAEDEFENQIYLFSSHNESNPIDAKEICNPVFITIPPTESEAKNESHGELSDEVEMKKQVYFVDNIEVVDLEGEEPVENNLISEDVENSFEDQEEYVSDSNLLHIDVLCSETSNQSQENLMKKQVNIKKKKQFFCEECDEVFTHHASLSSHQRLHAGGKVYNCDICTKTFLKYGNFIRHIRTHDLLKEYACDSCCQVFPSHSILLQHQNTHEEGSKFKCKVCDKLFQTLNELRSHKSSHMYKCEDCGKKFSRPAVFEKHRGTHTTTNTYYCEECGQAFSHRFALATHRRTHGGTFALL